MDQLEMLGEKIRELRKNSGWTQSHLEGASEVSERTIRRLESGESKPRQETLLALSSAFGIDVSELTLFLDVPAPCASNGEVLPVFSGETFLAVMAKTDELAVEVDESARVVSGNTIEILLDQMEWSEIWDSASAADRYRWGQQVDETLRDLTDLRVGVFIIRNVGEDPWGMHDLQWTRCRLLVKKLSEELAVAHTLKMLGRLSS